MRSRVRSAMIVVASLALTCGASAGEPKAVLKGPAASVRVGDDFRLRFTGTASDQDAVLQQAAGPDAAYIEINYGKDGKPLSATIECDRAGRYLFVLAAVGTDPAHPDQPARFAFAAIEIEVEDAAGPPNPDPTPDPSPGPNPTPPRPAPTPGTPEALGWDYHRTLDPILASFLADAANGPWTSTGDLAAAIRDRLDGGLTAAWAPVSAELTRRFGPTSAAPVDAATREQIRQFLVGVAGGVAAGKGAGR